MFIYVGYVKYKSAWGKVYIPYFHSNADLCISRMRFKTATQAHEWGKRVQERFNGIFRQKDEENAQT